MVALVIGILNLLGLFSIAWWCWKNDTSSVKKFYWPALLLKVASGLLLGLLYTYYYTANDTFYFFDAAIALSNKAQINFYEYIMALAEPDPRYFSGEARTLFFIKVVSVVTMLTHGNYWIASIYFSLVTFFAAWYLTKQLTKATSQIRIAAVVAFLFFPSVVFWSSGIIKESLAMAALYFLSAIVVKLWTRKPIALFYFILSLLVVWIVWNLKYYYIGLFLPVVGAALVVKWISDTRKFESFSVEIGLFLFMMILGISAASLLHPNFNLSVVADVLVKNNEAFIKASSNEDVIHYINLDASISSLFVNAPWALFSGLYRPFVWEAASVIQGLAALENLFLFILSGLAIGQWRRFVHSEFRILVFAVLVYSVLLCVFLALSSPNFGTLARYKVGFLPFLVLIICNNPVVDNFMSRVFGLK
jgi:hypothetical protein